MINNSYKFSFYLILFTFIFNLLSCAAQKQLPTQSKLSTNNNTWYKYTDSETVIIFLHGIFSNSHSCWSSSDSPPIYWPNLIGNDDQFENSSIFLAGYYTNIDSGDYGIRDAAHEVISALRRKNKKGINVLNKRNIIFVTHSTGGIVARYLIENNLSDFSKKSVGLVLIASPSAGSQQANRLEWLAELYGNRLGKQLQKGNELLADLDSRFKDLVNDNKIPNLVGVEAYENHFIIHNKLLPDKIRVVTKESAGRYFGSPILLRETDHFTVVKPTLHTHPAYELLLDFYQRHYQRQFKKLLTETSNKNINTKIKVDDEYDWANLYKEPLR